MLVMGKVVERARAHRRASQRRRSGLDIGPQHQERIREQQELLKTEIHFQRLLQRCEETIRSHAQDDVGRERLNRCLQELKRVVEVLGKKKRWLQYP